MTTHHSEDHMTDLDHLLSRLERGVLLPAEGEVLAAEVRRMRAERPVAVTAAMVRAAGEALEDECLTRRGHDLGTIHRDDIARAALEAALAVVAPSAPLDAPVAASGPLAGPERHPGGSTGRQAGAEGRCVHCDRDIEDRGDPGVGPHRPHWAHIPGGYATCYPQKGARSPKATPSTATSEPQGGVRGPDGDLERQGPHGAADGRTAARGGAQ